ncbi:MAG: ATP synthase subunit I [Gammaproteobacteria bacterium]|nr:ATP synthase subunit I [Gammaproteobacteria bacterium]
MHSRIETHRATTYTARPAKAVGELKVKTITIFRVLLLQFAVIVITAFAALIWQDQDVMFGVFYGGLIVLANASLLIWRILVTKKELHVDLNRHMKAFFRSSIERFLVVGGLFAVGLGLLKLNALGVLVGFIIAQLIYMFSGRLIQQVTK